MTSVHVLDMSLKNVKHMRICGIFYNFVKLNNLFFVLQYIFKNSMWQNECMITHQKFMTHFTYQILQFEPQVMLVHVLEVNLRTVENVRICGIFYNLFADYSLFFYFSGIFWKNKCKIVSV